MRLLTLSDAPVVLSNLGTLIETASEILHDIERKDVTNGVWAALMRGQALLSIAQDTCVFTVEAIEAGPDYALGNEERRMVGSDRGDLETGRVAA